MKLSFFTSVTNTSGREMDLEWHDFAINYLCKHHPQLVKDGELYSAAEYESNNINRADINVIGITAVIFDIDNKDMEGDQITSPSTHNENLAGLTWAWHSTFSTTPERPKFRIFIPLSRVVTPQEWPAVYRGTLALLANDPAIDPSSADLSRAYYRPAYFPSNKGSEFSGFVDGEILDADAMLEAGSNNVINFHNPYQTAGVAAVPRAATPRHDGRNDTLKAQVAACMSKGKGIDDTILEIIDYDTRKHRTPLFSDASENRGSSDVYANAMRFVVSIMGSVNSRRVKNGLPPEVPNTARSAHPAPELDVFTFPSDFDPGAIPPRPFIYGNLLMRGMVTGVASPGGVGKSVNSIAIGMSAATANEFMGDPVHEQVGVLVLNNEDDKDELKRRAAAIAAHYKIPFSTLTDRLQMISGYGNPYLIAKKDGDMVIATPVVSTLIEHINKCAVGLLIVDPFVSTTNASENDNTQIEAVVSVYKRIAAETGCAVLLVQHTKKSGSDSEAHAGDPEAMRGAGAMGNACRITLTLARMSEATAAGLGLDWAIGNRLLRRDDGKMNYALRAEDARWFYMHSVQIANGDLVGVPEPYDISSYAAEAARAREEERDERSQRKVTDIAAEVAHVLGDRSSMGQKDVVSLYRRRDDITDSAREFDIRSLPFGAENAIQIYAESELCRVWRDRAGGYATAPAVIKKEVLK